MEFIEKWILIWVAFMVAINVAYAQTDCEYESYKFLISGNVAAISAFDGEYMQLVFADRYCTKEMMTEGISYYHVRRYNCFTAKLSHSGFVRYGEFSASVGYGRCFGNRVAVNMQAVYLLDHAEQYASVHSFTVDVAAVCRITPKCALAMELYNPVHLRYGVSGGEVIPMQFDFRLLYYPVNQLIGSLYMCKTLPGELDVGVQGIWQPHRNLMIDLGFSNTHLQVGVHVPFRGFVAIVNCAWHYRAGFSPQCQLFAKF